MSTGQKIAIIIAGSVGFVVLAIGGCGALLYLSFKNADKEVSPKIDAIYSAIQHEDVGDIYKSQTTDEFQNAVTLDKFEEVSKYLGTRLGALKSKTLVGCKMSRKNTDTFLDVAYSAEFERGKGIIKTKLKKEDGVWKFVIFNVESPVFRVQCESCGTACDASAKFCPSCGKSRVEK